jgi:hypothetical protein
LNLGYILIFAAKSDFRGKELAFVLGFGEGRKERLSMRCGLFGIGEVRVGVGVEGHGEESGVADMEISDDWGFDSDCSKGMCRVVD